MKFVILLTMYFACFSCFTHETGERTKIRDETPVDATDANLRSVPSETPSIDNNNIGSFRVDVYDGDRLTSRYFFYNGHLRKEISYNTEINVEEYVTEYSYAKNGNFERVKVTKGDVSMLEEMFTRSVKDLKVQTDFLRSKGIEFSLPGIVPNSASDLSRIFSIADNYNDFKTDIRVDGNQKIIKFNGFNKRTGYERGAMTFRSGSMPILIKDYELTLENSYPLKEQYKTDEGELTKEYSYKDGKLIGVVYKFTDLNNRTNSLEKRFEYHQSK